MKTTRLILALIAAGLALPAAAEKCSTCNFDDEPLVVKGTVKKSQDHAAPSGLAAAPQGQRAVGLTPLEDRPAPGGLAGSGPTPTAAGPRYIMTPVEHAAGAPNAPGIGSSKPKEIVVVGHASAQSRSDLGQQLQLALQEANNNHQKAGAARGPAGIATPVAPPKPAMDGITRLIAVTQIKAAAPEPQRASPTAVGTVPGVARPAR